MVKIEYDKAIETLITNASEGNLKFGKPLDLDFC
jgi:hypothetical protein